ncbi:MAG TPA: 4'-phosphopantetheinyl transferase superfamily protein [Fibrobacteraceae bacterium]|nr:4'-phosphopantetheinyl transferase superfamily protein [Fibrobacteraceae bacterium]
MKALFPHSGSFSLRCGTSDVSLYWMQNEGGLSSDFDLTILNPVEQERLRSYTHFPAKAAFLGNRIWIRQVLGEHLGLAPAEVPLSADPHGRPLLETGPWRLSWTHSRNAIVLALVRDAQVGVDLEFHRPRQFLELATRFFHAAELQHLDMISFYRLWTRKEALFKCVGGSLLEVLACDVRQDFHNGARLLELRPPVSGAASLSLALRFDSDSG